MLYIRQEALGAKRKIIHAHPTQPFLYQTHKYKLNNDRDDVWMKIDGICSTQCILPISWTCWRCPSCPISTQCEQRSNDMCTTNKKRDMRDALCFRTHISEDNPRRQTDSRTDYINCWYGKHKCMCSLWCRVNKSTPLVTHTHKFFSTYKWFVVCIRKVWLAAPEITICAAANANNWWLTLREIDRGNAH